MSSGTVNIPIQWLNDIKLQFCFISSKVVEIDAIKSTINSVLIKMNKIDSKMKIRKDKISEFEDSIQYSNATIEELTTSQSDTRATIYKFRGRKGYWQILIRLTKKKRIVNNSITDLQCRSMRNNLPFYGFTERPLLEDNNSREECEQIIRHFVKIA